MKIKAKLEIPAGYRKVTAGKVREHDLVLNVFGDRGMSWDSADNYEVNDYVDQYYGVIRPKPPVAAMSWQG